MVTLLRVLVVALGVACLLAIGAWLVLDARATDLLRSELAGHGLRRVLTVEQAGLADVGRLEARGISLFDPLTGDEVAHLDKLEAQAGLGDGWFSPQLAGLRGEGGRATFSHDVDGLPFVRAIGALLDALAGRGGGPSGPPPTLQLDVHGIEAVLRAPGEATLVVPGCDVHVAVDADGTRVDITLGGTGGLVVLGFSPEGLQRVQVAGVRVGPVCALFLPDSAQDLANELRPRGVLDLDLSLVPGDEHAARAEGRLREAALSPAHLPFALHQGSLPFVYEKGRMVVHDARLDFPGGTLQAGLDADEHGFTLDVEARDAAFRRDYLQLIPNADQIAWLAPEDGGRLDLLLRVSQRLGGRTEVEGWGGLFVERLRMGPTGVLVEDVVGSLDVRNDVLTFHEMSGRCSGGAVTLSGTLNLRTGETVADGALFDVDIARLDRALEMPGAEEREMAGWMQASVHWEGRIGEPRSARSSGQLSVRGGYLWRVPVLDAVLRALTLAAPAEKRADTLSVDFRQRGATWYIDEARLESDFLTLRAEGRITRGGALNLQITPVSAGGMIGDVLRYLQRQLVALDLKGTWNAPQVRVLPLKVVTGPIGTFLSWVRGLFGGDEDSEAQPEQD